MAHASLGGEVDHPVEGRVREGCVHRAGVGEIGPEEGPGGAGVARRAVELGQPGFLERRVVIGIDVVEAGHGIAARHQRARHVEADEAGRSRDEDAHPPQPAAAGTAAGIAAVG